MSMAHHVCFIMIFSKKTKFFLIHWFLFQKMQQIDMELVIQNQCQIVLKILSLYEW